MNPHLAAGQQPVLFLERPLAHGSDPKAGGVFQTAEVARVGAFWVPQSDLNMEGVKWGITNSGQYVRVPIFAYRTAQRALSALFGLGVQLGMQAMANQALFALRDAKVVTLVLGHECHDLGEDGFRCYLGLAVELAERKTP